MWIRALRGQSMDCKALARSMDCATTHTCQAFGSSAEVFMFDRKPAFEADCITKSFVKKKKKVSKVIRKERKRNRGLPFGWRRQRRESTGMQCFRLAISLLISQAVILAILKNKNPGISIEDAAQLLQPLNHATSVYIFTS